MVVEDEWDKAEDPFVYPNSSQLWLPRTLPSVSN